jgi:hydroxyethylthiazole kinase-like sugar kinase family protein
VPIGDSPETERQDRGFLHPATVRMLAFWTTTGCIVVAVTAATLAIWQFTGTDALWRTVATCGVIGAGTMLFSWINGVFAPQR